MDGPAFNDTSLIRIAIFIALSPLTLLMLLVILLWKAISFSADATDSAELMKLLWSLLMALNGYFSPYPKYFDLYFDFTTPRALGKKKIKWHVGKHLRALVTTDDRGMISGSCALSPRSSPSQSRASSSYRSLPAQPTGEATGWLRGCPALAAQLSLLPAARRARAGVTGTGPGCRAPGDKQRAPKAPLPPSSHSPAASEAGPASPSTAGSGRRGSEGGAGGASSLPRPRAAPPAPRGLPALPPAADSADPRGVWRERRERSREGRRSGASSVPPPPPEPRLPLRLHFPACGAGAGQEVPCA